MIWKRLRPIRPDHLRVGILAVNVLLAASLPVLALHGIRNAAGANATNAVGLPTEYAFELASARGPHRGSQIAQVADWLEPAPRPKDIDRKVEPETPLPAAAETLANNWEYVFYIHTVDGSANVVSLARKQSADATAPQPSAARWSRQRSSRARLRGRRGTPADEARIWFSVHDRHIRDADFDLDFLVLSADENELIYAFPDDPATTHALPHVDRSGGLSKSFTVRDARARTVHHGGE